MKLKMEEGIYEGQVSIGQPQGKGKLVYTNPPYNEHLDYYEGSWQDGLFHGKGKLVLKNGDIYEGKWVEGNLPFGRETTQNGFYEGSFKDLARHGKGKFTVNETTYFEGDFKEGEFVYGKEVNAFGYFIGGFHDGMHEGFGTEHLVTGRKWAGMWHEDKKVEHPSSDPIPNALRIWPLGNVDLIKIEDFSTSEGLGKPLNCDRIDIISTQALREISQEFEITLVGYIDKYASQKETVNNYLMCDMSGYDYLPGACILCGFENNDYAPLPYEKAEEIYDCLVEVVKELKAEGLL